MLLIVLIVFFIAPPGLCGTVPLQEEPARVEDHLNLGLLPNHCGVMTNKRFFGNQTLLYELPWMVMLSYTTGKGNRLGCIGTLINERYVLTAAQCVTSIGDRTLNGVILGEHDVRTDPDCEEEIGGTTCGDKVINVTVEEIISHPGYKVGSQDYSDDIALLRLAQPVDFKLESVGPVCLPITTNQQRNFLAGDRGIIAGWGLGGDKIDLPVLSNFDVGILRNDDCQTIYNRIKPMPPQISHKHVCVRSNFNFQGDAGGPLMVFEDTGRAYSYVQRGVISFGPRDKNIEIPNVYTNVAYYMKWILNTLRK